jgi:hypothetical protein
MPAANARNAPAVVGGFNQTPLVSCAAARGVGAHGTQAARADTILLRTLRGNMGFDNAGIICTSAKEAIDHTAYCVGLDRKCVVFKISGG